MTPLSRRPARPTGFPHSRHPSIDPQSTAATATGAMAGARDSEADTLVDLLTQQRDLYATLGQLSGQQQDIIAHDQTEQLLAVLSQRQGIVSQLTRINARITPLRQRMAAISEAAPEATRQTIRQLVNQVQEMLQSIMADDERDRRTLEESKQRVSRELNRVKSAPAAVNAYRSSTSGIGGAAGGLPMRGAARFTDSRG